MINQFVDLAFGVDENTDTGSAGLNPASFTSVTTSNSQCPIDEGNLELYLGFDLSKFNSNVPACHGRCLPTTPPPPLDRSNGRTPVLNEGFYNDIPVIFGNIALSEFIDLPNSRGSHSVFTVTNSGFLVTAYTRLANAELSLNNPTALASRARTIAGNLGSTNDFSQTVRQSSNFCNVLMEKPIGSANTCIPHSQDGTKFVEFRYKTGSGTRDCLERYVLEIIPGPPVVIVKRYYTWGHYFTGTWIPIEMNPVP